MSALEPKNNINQLLRLTPKTYFGASFVKHLRIFLAFVKASIQADMEYRLNFVSRVATDVVWYLAHILTFETLYLHTSQIGGWTAPQMRVFLGLLFVVDALFMILFNDNLERFNDKIRKGDLDLLLMKPVNSQMMISLQRQATAILGNLVLATAWLSWALYNLPGLQTQHLPLLLLYIPAGLTILYAIRFMVASMAVIFTRADSLQYMWYQIYKLGMRPDSIYSPWLRYAMISVLPVLAVVALPADAIVNGPGWGMTVYLVVLAGFFLWLSSKVWNFALSKYTSASS